jgi:predicted nucleotidyltransferase component of viral defense system
VQNKSTIFANKLVALTERNTNRDIYDVFFFIQQNFDINEDVILERTGLSKIDLFKNIILKLNKL